MKTLLLLLLVALCGIAWRSPDIIEALDPRRTAPFMPEAASPTEPRKPMSLQEYAGLAQKDPDAYRKLLDGAQRPAERGEVDKLMNFFARGKYE